VPGLAGINANSKAPHNKGHVRGESKASEGDCGVHKNSQVSVLALLGSRVAYPLRSVVTALAIADERTPGPSCAFYNS
jgi:hypothetical protein